MRKTKTIAFALVLAVFAGMLAGCGGQTADSPSGPAAEENAGEEALDGKPAEDPEGKDDLPEFDFGGREFVFVVPANWPGIVYDIWTESENGDLVNDAAYKRTLEVSDRFNVAVSDKKVENIDQHITKNNAAGSVDYAAAWPLIRSYGKLSQQNMFVDLNEVTNIDLGKKYWDRNVVRDFTINGKLYGIMGDISTSVSYLTHLLGVNKTIAQDNGVSISEIYQSVREGKWTFDRLYAITKTIYKDLDGDGKRNYADVYGFGVSPAVHNAAFSASGEKWMVKDEKGELILMPLTERIVSVYEKLSEILSDYQSTLTTWNIGEVKSSMLTIPYEYVYIDKFANNTVLFADIDVNIIMKYRQLMDTDFGIVPFPKFEESQPHYSVYAYQAYPMLTVSSVYAGDAESLEFIGAVLEGLAAASYRTLTPAFYDKSISTKYTRDDESIEMLDIILRSRIYDFMNIYDLGGLDSAIWAGIQTERFNIASLFEKHQARIEKDIQKLVDAYAQND